MCEKNTSEKQVTLGSRIAALRKGANLTQEQLAERLGVTFQAVSKWENDISCPDVLLLPTLAGVFGVTLDALFGIEQAGSVPAAAQSAAASDADFVDPERPVQLQQQPPWPDDPEQLYAVIYQGHTLLQAQQVLRCADDIQSLRLTLTADVAHVQAYFNADITGQVYGDVIAGGSVHCGMVDGDVKAGANLTCGDIGGDAHAGRELNAHNIAGDAEAGADLTCETVYGDLQAAGVINCGTVNGDINAQGDVTCGDVRCDVNAGGSVTCGNVGCDVNAEGSVWCAAVDGDVNAEGNVTCSAVQGDVNAGGEVHFCADTPGETTAAQFDMAAQPPAHDKKKKGFNWKIKIKP